MLAPGASVSALLLLCQTSCQTGSGRSCARHEDSNTSTDQSEASSCAPIGRWDLMNCDKENTVKKKKNHKWRRNDRTNFIYKHDHDAARGRGRRSLVERASSRALNEFQYLWVATFHRETNWTKRVSDERSKVRAALDWSFETRHFDDVRSSQSLLWFNYRALSTSSVNSKLLSYCFNICDKFSYV